MASVSCFLNLLCITAKVINFTNAYQIYPYNIFIFIYILPHTHYSFVHCKVNVVAKELEEMHITTALRTTKIIGVAIVLMI